MPENASFQGYFTEVSFDTSEENQLSFLQNSYSAWSFHEPHTVFPHIRPWGIIIPCSLQKRVVLENTTFLIHNVIRIAGIIRVAGITRGRALYEEIR